ncbi:hypothetical protein B0T36_19980 [Nocardia donostiensis]|uniref:hypothetical protein n=1 Tax=Nocardia donostiensis TaxID=1538463 RepID=UPI0009DAA03A|nr:hypothetical protein [Nocardia donostiensis]OQS13383.1 hypothetical protein B0T36_19980 [Nocardia donostiensis]
MKSERPDNNRVVPPPIPDAEKHLEAVVAELRGQHLADVMYYPLTIGDDGRLAEKWDFGDWHEPTMGVELTFHSGHRYSAIWNNTFTEYGLEIFPKPMIDVLLVAPGGSVTVPVSDHRHWVGLIGKKIIAADICWDHDPSGTIRVPSAIRLGFRGTAVWIAAGCSVDTGPATSSRLGTDDVIVVFTREMSSQTGIPESR